MASRFDEAALTITRESVNMLLTFPQGYLLQEAPSITGPWTTLNGALSPLQIDPARPQAYYRLRSE